MAYWKIPVIVLLLLATGCAPPTAAPPPTQEPAPVPTRASKTGTIRYMHLPNVDVRFVPTFMALDALQAQGYVIERTALATSTLIVDALARGDADLGSLNPQTMWAAIAKGTAVRSIMEGIPSPGLNVARKEIQSCQDLNGKRVGFAATTGTNPSLFNLYVSQNCPNIKFTTLVIPDSAGRVAALLAGQIDASQLPLEDTLNIERQAPGSFHRIMDFSKDFPNLLSGVLNVRQEWAKQNPEAVKDFIRELLIAQRQVNENPAVLYDESVKRLNMPLAQAKESGDANRDIGTWSANGGLSRENVQFTLDFSIKINALPATLKADDVADLTFLNAVLDEIGRK